MAFASAPVNSNQRLFRRLVFPVSLALKWFCPDGRNITFPVAVILNRFATAFLVLSFGMKNLLIPFLAPIKSMQSNMKHSYCIIEFTFHVLRDIIIYIPDGIFFSPCSVLYGSLIMDRKSVNFRLA